MHYLRNQFANDNKLQSIPAVNGKKRSRTSQKNLLWKRHVFLAQYANITIMPSRYECNLLKDMGLGESSRIIALNRNWSIPRTRQYLCRMFPLIPLAEIGFDIAKTNKMRKLTILDVNTVEELEKEIRYRILVLIPHRDIPLPVPQDIYEKQIKLEEFRESQMGPNTSQISQGDVFQYTINESTFMSEETTEDECDINTALDVLKQSEELDVINMTRNSEIDKDNILLNFLNVYESDLPDYLTEEMFTLFWKSAEKQYFRGESVIVPFVPVHRIRKDRNTFNTLGKILGHMWMTTGTIPWNIARTTYLHIGNPLCDIPDTILLADMLMFVTKEERKILEKGLNDFATLAQEELSVIESFFLSYGYHDSLSKHQFYEQLLSLAADLIVHRPKELVIQMRKGFPVDSLTSFLKIVEKDQISQLLIKQKPTVQKVLNILKHGVANLSNDQMKVFYYLQVYLKSLRNDNEQLLKFIFFVTGSVQMPKQITVTFNNSTGMQRHTVAKKCTCTLELSYAYNCYQEFKRELNSHVSSCLA